ncbi:MAG TPA: uracil phosphoribosyltransferase [Crocinitomix sp.]|nr:uracil phosphoribosyltransferase [Crocinitomix sp.]
MVLNLSNQNSVFNQFIAEIRDVDIQQDAMRFRRNIERIGEVLGYELSKELEYVEEEIFTPLGIAKENLIKNQPVIASILRAGLPLHNGLLNLFDQAENAFVSAYRKEHKDGTFEVHVDYLAAPNIDDKVLIIADPMLATGRSMELVYKALLQKGKPKQIHVVSVIASKTAIEHIQTKLPKNTKIWVGAIDDELTAQSYIVPGLGDAGDLAYGQKS